MDVWMYVRRYVCWKSNRVQAGQEGRPYKARAQAQAQAQAEAKMKAEWGRNEPLSKQETQKTTHTPNNTTEGAAV